MELNILGQVDRLTKPRSSGKVMNPHVIPYSKPPEPDYERMRKLAHPSEDQGDQQDC